MYAVQAVPKSQWCPVSYPATPLAQRFADSILVGDDCWEWTAYKNRKGYGVITEGREKSYLAHRASYQLFREPIPDGMCVCHTCDNPSCVKPSHLFLGTRADNLADMRAKGRGIFGEHHHHARLTAVKVLAIRRRCSSGEIQAALASEFGVCQPTLSKIVNRHAWRHI